MHFFTIMSMSKIVMIVDDDTDLLDGVNEVISSAGYRTVTEVDGKRAPLLFREYGPDLVLTDFRMPGLNGYDSYLEIKKANPNAKVIFMTSFPDDVRLRDAINQGEIICLKKPFSNESLLQVIENKIGH
ncbi:response regulator [Nitrosopumilus sp. b1]|nr:response regulator [Nitrosopumilus sp. b1]